MRRALRLAPALLALAACRSPDAASRSGQVRYEGHTLEEYWGHLRAASDARSGEAGRAIRMLGPAAVPFLAAKAASHTLEDNIAGSVSLENLCPNALPAMKAARDEYPSASLDAAIRRVEAEAADRVKAKICAPDGRPVLPEARQ